MKKPKLFLHIGTEKTGTSSIQAFATKNFSRLLTHAGIHYPLYFGARSGQTRIVLLAYELDRIDELVLAQGLHDPKDRQEKRKEWTHKLEQIVRHTPAPIVFLSSEHFQSRLRTRNELVRLRSLLAPLFNSIDIVIYLRKPIDCATSMLSTAIKGGQTQVLLPEPSDEYIKQVCDSRKTIETWAEIFPRSKIIVRPFNRNVIKCGDVVSDIFDIMGLQSLDSYDRVAPENESLSLQAMHVLSTLNKKIPKFHEKGINPFREDLAEHVQRYFGEDSRYIPSPKEAAAYSHAFTDSMSWIANTFWDGDMAFWGNNERALDSDNGWQHCLDTLSKMKEDKLLKSMISCFEDAWIKKASSCRDRVTVSASREKSLHELVHALKQEIAGLRLQQDRILSKLKHARALNSETR